MKTLTFLLVLVLAGTACSETDKANDDGGINSATNAVNGLTGNGGTSNNQASNNVTPTNSGSNTTTELPDEPYITQFSYVSTSLASGNLGRLTFYRDGRIGTGQNAGEGNNQLLTPEATAEFIAAHLGPETITKMREGWGCRELGGNEDMGPVVDGGSFDPERSDLFEARIFENGGALEAQIITGCVFDEDPATAEIVDALKTLALLNL